MPYCSRCGVEVDDRTTRCPLCTAPIQRFPGDDGTPWPAEEAPAPSPPPMTTAEKKGLARTLTTIGFLIPTSIVLAVDWFLSRSLTWSLYALAGLGSAWLWAIAPLALGRRPYLLIAAEAFIGALLLGGLALLTGTSSWLLPLAFPLLGVASALAVAATALARRAKRIGGNLAGWVLASLGVLALATDVLVNAYVGGRIHAGWSLIALAALLPVAALLLYLHYRPSRRARLRRYFHL